MAEINLFYKYVAISGKTVKDILTTEYNTTTEATPRLSNNAISYELQ